MRNANRGAEPMADITEVLSGFEGSPRRFNKYFELLLLKDDSKPYSHIDKQELRFVTIVPTTVCNLDCIWCHRKEERLKGYLGREMPWETMERILPKLDGFKSLYFGGFGEPLLYKRLFDAIRLAKRFVPDVRTTTNGTTLTKANSEKLAEAGLSLLEISIDGFEGDVNEKTRGVKDGRIIENLRYFSEISDIPVQVNSVLTELNYDSLFNAIDRLRDIKNIVTFHTIPPFWTIYMKERAILGVSPEKHRRLLDHWKNRMEQLGLKYRLYPDVNETSLDPIIHMKQKHNICFSVYADVFVNVDGKVTACGRVQEIPLDDLLENDFDSAWNGEKIVRWRKDQLEGKYCKECMTLCNMKYTYSGQGAAQR